MNDNSRNGDILMMIMSCVGVIIICIVFIRNHTDGDWVNKQFEANAYYELPDKVTSGMNEVAIYNSVKTTNAETCPQANMVGTRLGKVSLTSQGNAYQHDTWIANGMSVYGTSTALAVVTPISDSDVENKVLQALELSSQKDSLWTSTSQDGTPIYSAYDLDYCEGYCEIIAPFYFSFGNTNTSKERSIILYNKAMNLRITFLDVANWYCAGSYDYSDEWLSHGTISTDRKEDYRHKTIIGNTANADISGGQPGQVVGYATSETRMLIEILNNGKWEVISIRDWILGTK